MNNRILFLYTGGRAKRVSEPAESYAKDFFYGLHEFQKEGYEVDFVERIIPDFKPRNLLYRWLAMHNEWAARQLTMGNNAPFFLPHLEKIQQADVIISVGDSIALAPEYFKLCGWTNAKIIHVSMGMANYWKENESRGFKYPRLVKWYYRRLLKQADKIITLGLAENNKMIEIFPNFKSKIQFIPFGIDIDFWKPNVSETKDIDILFIGNDMRRDYDLVHNLTIGLPDLTFVLVSKNMGNRQFGKNVVYHNGSWRDEGLSDAQVRRLYQRAKILINPIKPTFQPSGQSVTLQAMACGVPVLISKFKGFWEPTYYNKTNIYVVKNNTVEEWKTAIGSLIENNTNRLEMGKRGHELTKEHYTSKIMVGKYIQIVNSM